jgi:hypothetical protein
MKYVILIMDTEAGLRLTEAEREPLMGEIGAWYDKWSGAGKLADGGHQLDSADKARTVRAGRVVDGPFMETKEVLGGYSVIEADTIDEAVELAKSWPGVDRGLITIEVRPVLAG